MAARVWQVSAVVRPAADIWSVGCCIYEFALGTRMFRSDVPSQQQNKLEKDIGALVQSWQQERSSTAKFTGRAAPPCNRLTLLLGINEVWVSVIWDCCNNDPTQRPSSIGSLAVMTSTKSCLPMPWCLSSASFPKHTRCSVSLCVLPFL